jgi:small conductance mechanosensitive channel
VDVAQHELARRQQRYRSLVRVCHRLINVLGVLGVGLWILLDIPGVRSTSVSLVLAGGALLGALALVFQGLLRDFTAGLVMLLEDRYAIGDWIEVDDHEGEVIDVGLFSTQVRCLDQRVHILNNALIQQLRNHTKLRSGSLVTLLITRVGEQWATEREFQRRALQALHRRGVQIADGLELMPSLPPADVR